MLTRSAFLLLGTLTTCVPVILSSPGSLAAQDIELREGRTVLGNLVAGDTARYTVTLGADSFLYGEVNQVSVDVDVRLIGPDGSQLRRFGGLGAGSERFFSRIAEGGPHSIEVVAAGEGTRSRSTGPRPWKPIPRSSPIN